MYSYEFINNDEFILKQAITDEEKTSFLTDISPIIAVCSESHGVSDEAIKTAADTINVDGINSCFMACVLKDMGIVSIIKYKSNYTTFRAKFGSKNILGYTEAHEWQQICAVVGSLSS